jgi:hypothetical protein
VNVIISNVTDPIEEPMKEETPTPDPVFSRICESSARLMAGLVNKSTIKELQKTVNSSASDYPWEVVVDRVLRDPVEPSKFTTQALRSQRDWVVRGGRETPGKGIRRHTKTFVARMLARLIFLAILIPAVVMLLVLVKHKWPDVDIYRILGWLKEVWPAVFGPR